MTSNELHRDRTIVYSCRYPVVFFPKYRRKVPLPPIDDRGKALILEKQDEYGDTFLEMEVMPDHVRLLLDVDPRIVRSKGSQPTPSARNIPGSNPGCRLCGPDRV